MLTFLTTFNFGYIEFAKNNIINYLETFENFNNNLSMVCMDEESYDAIITYLNSLNNSKKDKITIKKKLIPYKESASFNSSQFYKITHNKLEIILNELKNVEILHFFDSDVFFFKNPTELFLEKIQQFDIIFQLDQPFTYHHDLYHNYVCTGNFTIKNNTKTINFIENIIKHIDQNQNDQEVVFNYLNSKGKNIKEFNECNLDVYDPELIQNGYDSFIGNWKNNSNKICVHANHMIGKTTKINALKSIGGWKV